jgi:hypothetical protein
LLQRIRLTQTEHPVWSQAFVEPVRCDQVEEDLFAARTVCGVLIAIVTGGALLGALAVVLATLL